MGYYSFAELAAMGIQVPPDRLANSPDQKITVSDLILERLKSGETQWVKHSSTTSKSASETMSEVPQDNDTIKTEVQKAVEELKALGITDNTQEHEREGLGDVVENVLKKFGITEDRFKQWFNLKECGCKERKKFLNGILSWHKKKKEET